MEPLEQGRILDLEDPNDVDWLYKWAQNAQTRINELEAKIIPISKLSSLLDMTVEQRIKLKIGDFWAVCGKHKKPILDAIDEHTASLQALIIDLQSQIKVLKKQRYSEEDYNALMEETNAIKKELVELKKNSSKAELKDEIPKKEKTGHHLSKINNSSTPFWCKCGHQHSQHFNGRDCQVEGCNCITFRPVKL